MWEVSHWRGSHMEAEQIAPCLLNSSWTNYLQHFLTPYNLNLSSKISQLTVSNAKPPDIHGLWTFLALFGVISTSGKATSLALPMISKKLSKATFGSSFITQSHGAVFRSFSKPEGGKVVRERGNHYSSNVSIDLVGHKDVVNERGRGVVYTSWPCDDREQAVWKHWLQICICQLMVCKIQNVDIKVRQDLTFTIFVIFICLQLFNDSVVGGNG